MLGRRTTAVLASVLVAGAVVLFDPHAPDAMALGTPPPPVTVTTTVAGAAAGADGAAAVGALGATGGTAVGTTATLAGGVSATALTGTVVAGLAIGTYAGQWVLKALPDSWYSTSGSTFCDAQLALNPDAACGQPGPAEGYVINGDVAGAVPGWEPSPPFALHLGLAQYSSPYGRLVVPMTVSVDISDLAYGSASGSLTVVIDQAVTVPSASPAWNIYRSASIGFFCSVGDPATNPAVQRSAITLSEVVAQRTVHIADVCASGGGGGYQYVGARVIDAAQGGDTSIDLPAVGPVVGAFRPLGDPLRQDVDADPERHWGAQWQCSDGTTGGAVSVFFHESDATWPSIPAASCASGIVTHYEVSKVTTSGPTTSVLTWDAPQVVKDFYAAGGTGAECWDGSCTLVLYRIDPQTGQRLSCFSNPSLCVDWWSSATKADDMECQYGGQVVGLAECDLYRPTFNLAAGQPVKDKDGATVSNPAPYGDPTDQGNPIPDPSGEPSPDPNPGPEPDSSCPPPFTWTSLVNPWWYYKAGTCALEWAFVPSPTTMQQWSSMTTDVAGRAPVSYMVGGSQWITAAADGANGDGSCANGPFEMADGEVVTGSFDLCETAVVIRQTTWGTVLYNIVTAAVVGGSLFIAWKRIAGSLGGKG